MKEPNKELLEMLDDMDIEEREVSELEMKRIRKMQKEKFGEELRNRRSMKKRIYSSVAAVAIILAGSIVAFRGNGEDRNIADNKKNKDGEIRITSEGNREDEIIDHKGPEFVKDEITDTTPDNEHHNKTPNNETGTEEKTNEKIEEKPEEVKKPDKITTAENEKDTNEDMGVSTAENKTDKEEDANKDKSSLSSERIIENELKKLSFKPKLPEFTLGKYKIEEIIGYSRRLNVVFVYKNKSFMFVASADASDNNSDEVINNYDINGIQVGVIKSGLGIKYRFHVEGVYYELSPIGNVEKKIVDEIIKEMK